MRREDQNTKGFYSITEAAEYSGLNYHTLRRWAMQGKIVSKTVADRMYIDWDSLAKYADLPPE